MKNSVFLLGILPLLLLSACKNATATTPVPVSPPLAAADQGISTMTFPPSSLSSEPMQSLPIIAKAPELEGLGEWFNSQPLTLASLKGKVVLIDFWTFECINCIHTLPSVKGLWKKYQDQPFMVIGVHTPEVPYEQSPDHLRDAIAKDGLTYPVVQDNDYMTWNAYHNRYWPAFYLIDANGNVRYQHFGEGSYETLDKNIQSLLSETGSR